MVNPPLVDLLIVVQTPPALRQQLSPQWRSSTSDAQLCSSF
jgi:hypothetical protein